MYVVTSANVVIILRVGYFVVQSMTVNIIARGAKGITKIEMMRLVVYALYNYKIHLSYNFSMRN